MKIYWKPIFRTHTRVALLGMAVFALADCGDEQGADEIGTTASALTNSDLAFHYAPIHYQDVFKKSGTGLNGVSDYMVRFDSDGDFNGRNNWDNANFLRPASMHFSVNETTSHFFIAYMMFHPRDWAAGTAEEHENDAETAIMLVRKDGSQFGVLEAIVTEFHSNWKSYRAQTYVGRGPCNPETPADIQIELGRPRTYQEPQGHGLIGCTSSTGCVKNDDGIRYEPWNGVGTPPFPNTPPFPIPDGKQVSISYTLVDMKPLLDRRWDAPVFSDPSTMAGDSSSTCGDGLSTCKDDAALGFWAHSDERLASFPAACDPIKTAPGEDEAAFMGAFFTFGSLPPPSTTYVTNNVLHQKCVTGRRMQGSPDPCVQQICAQDSFCCNTAWDGLCVGEVQSICGKPCTNCAQNVCASQQGPIGTGCNSLCAQQVCSADPFCCNTSWDGICVSEVPTICGLSCAP